MDINWGRGMMRLAYAFLLFVWVVAIVFTVMDYGTKALGTTVAYLALFSVVFLVVCRGVGWIAAGFRRE